MSLPDHVSGYAPGHVSGHVSGDGSGHPEAAEEFHAAWVAELDRLEVDVELAEAMLAADRAAELSPPAPWQPPVLRAPLPSDLEPRARLVLERQLAVAHRMTERLTETGRHRRLTQAIRNTAQPDIPIYVDLNA